MKQHDYCEGTDKEKEQWIVTHIKPQYRNGYREVMNIPLKEKEDEIKTDGGNEVRYE
jgi:hypothetical protein